MADEGQTPRYSTASSGSNQAAQETNEASSTPDNDSEDPQIRPGVTPEAQRPLFTTSASSSDTAQPSTSCAVILEESAGSDKEWNDMLNDWYEQTIGSPRIAPFLHCTNGVPLSTTPHTLASTFSTSEHENELQSESTAFWIPMDNNGASLSQPSASQESVVQEPGISENNSRTSGATSNFEPNMEYYEADDPFFSFDVYDNGSAGVPYPTFSRSDWDKVASRSRTGIEQPSATPENYTRIPAGTLTLQSNDAYGHVRMTQYRVAGSQPSASSGDDSITVLESMVRRLEINEESVTLINGASNRGGTYNVKPVPEHGEASHVSTYTTATGMNGLPVPASSDGAYNSDPSTSHEGIEETMQGCDASGATGSTKWKQRKDGVRGEVNRGKKPPRERRHTCEICNKSFQCDSHLVRHRRIHTGEKPYRCDICAKLFTQQSALAGHLRTHSSEKRYTCEICDKSFTQNSSLVQHRHIHTGEKPYRCHICAQSFTRHHTLVRHRRTHSGEKPYQCETCTQCFAESGSLRKHQRTHTGERPFKCEICAHSFPTRYHLQRHRRTHTGERPFKCEICAHSFTTRDHLQRHRRTHADRKLCKPPAQSKDNFEK